VTRIAEAGVGEDALIFCNEVVLGLQVADEFALLFECGRVGRWRGLRERNHSEVKRS